MHRPENGFPKEVNARPQALAENVLAVPHSLPCFHGVAAFASEEGLLRETLVILLVELLLVVVANHVEGIEEAQIAGKLRESGRRGDGAGGILLLDLVRQHGGQDGQTLHVRLSGIVHMFGIPFGIAKHPTCYSVYHTV